MKKGSVGEGFRISHLENVADDFFALLSDMRDGFMRPLEQKRRCQLGHVQHFAVSVLCRKGSLSMSALAQEMQISKQQLTPLVYKLINQGLLTKKKDPADRRVVRIEITEQGRNMFRELFAEIKQDFVARLKILPDEEIDELGRALKRIREVLGDMEKAPIRDRPN